jgi:uncharacterized membrane protein YozB (DUF420 family)
VSVNDIPTLDACLNGASAVLLTMGLAQIKRGRRGAHRACMLTAFVTSSLFLVGYVTHKILIKGVHTPFLGPVALKPFYLAMLLSHTVLAAAIVPLALITLNRALKERFDRHKQIARWTWPLWMYVSVTGVVIYFVLHQIWPAH